MKTTPNMNIADYTGILVFAEQRSGRVEHVAYELLTKARELADARGVELTALLMGYNVEQDIPNLFVEGADRVILIDTPELEHYLTEPYTHAFHQVIQVKRPEIVLLGATTIGRDLGPRLSARLMTGLTADCTSLELSDDGHLMMTRPAFGGNLCATILCKEHRPQIATVRPGVMRRKPASSRPTGRVERMSITFPQSGSRVRLKQVMAADKPLVDITQAKVLISGGRGVGTREGFDKLHTLASLLNGEVSASRAMVDAGLIGHDRQVGQTGKTVRPHLYMACGISGAIQHLAGMEESEYIIAINKDRYAPIMEVADIAIVGDLHQILPVLSSKIAQASIKS